MEALQKMLFAKELQAEYITREEDVTIQNPGIILTAVSALNVQSALIFAAIFLLISAIISRNKQERKWYPPGPPPLPLIGNVHILGKDFREPLKKLAAWYGDVMTIFLGPKPAVILNSYKAIKEAFVTKGNSFVGRPRDPIIETYMNGGWGLVLSNGKLWQDHRRFSLSVLRDFGMGKAMLEDKITGEIQHFLGQMRQQSGRPYDPKLLINKAVANVIHSMIFSDRCDYDDPDMLFHLETVDQSFKVVTTSGLLQLFPSIIHLPFDLLGFWKVEANIRKSKAMHRQQIEEHRQTYDPNVTRDFVDAYLHEIKKRENLQDTFHDDQMLGVIGDLFAAGTETTSTTLRWAIAFMICHPDVQQKVQAEIDDVIGRDRMPSMHDRLNMPYTEAALMEIQRLGSVAPFGVPHETTEDVTLQGHTIPSGTFVLANIHNVHRDPKLWSNPEEFDPERFLKTDGVTDRKENLIPFLIGKRACLGESLARMELFLFFTTMLQHLHFSNPPACPLPSLKGVLAVTCGPEPFEVIATPRGQERETSCGQELGA